MDSTINMADVISIITTMVNAQIKSLNLFPSYFSESSGMPLNVRPEPTDFSHADVFNTENDLVADGLFTGLTVNKEKVQALFGRFYQKSHDRLTLSELHEFTLIVYSLTYVLACSKLENEEVSQMLDTLSFLMSNSSTKSSSPLKWYIQDRRPFGNDAVVGQTLKRALDSKWNLRQCLEQGAGSGSAENDLTHFDACKIVDGFIASWQAELVSLHKAQTGLKLGQVQEEEEKERVLDSITPYDVNYMFASLSSIGLDRDSQWFNSLESVDAQLSEAAKLVYQLAGAEPPACFTASPSTGEDQSEAARVARLAYFSALERHQHVTLIAKMKETFEWISQVHDNDQSCLDAAKDSSDFQTFYASSRETVRASARDALTFHDAQRTRGHRVHWKVKAVSDEMLETPTTNTEKFGEYKALIRQSPLREAILRYARTNTTYKRTTC